MQNVRSRSEKWQCSRDVDCREGEAAEYVCNCLFPPRFRGVKGNAGVSRGEAIEASVTAAIQSPGAQQIPGPALVGGGARTGTGSNRNPKSLFFPLLSPAQEGPGSCWEFA